MLLKRNTRSFNSLTCHQWSAERKSGLRWWKICKLILKKQKKSQYTQYTKYSTHAETSQLIWSVNLLTVLFVRGPLLSNRFNFFDLNYVRMVVLRLYTSLLCPLIGLNTNYQPNLASMQYLTLRLQKHWHETSSYHVTRLPF